MIPIKVDGIRCVAQVAGDTAEFWTSHGKPIRTFPEPPGCRLAGGLRRLGHLQLDGRWLMDRPWSGRRQILEETLEPGLYVAINPVVHEDGRGLFQRAVAADFEGVVGKKKTSKYQPGERSADWRKIKNWQVTEAWVV